MTQKGELMHLIGNNVRKYRMERKLTQQQLADIVNCDNSAITRIESGTRMMSVPMLRAIAQALGVSCDALLFDNKSNVHVHNIVAMLQGQSPESLAHTERVVQLLLQEYGYPKHNSAEM